jgi:hypothetical protein
MTLIAEQTMASLRSSIGSGGSAERAETNRLVE